MDLLASEIKKVINGEVSEDYKTLEFYSRDASLFKLKPKVVVFPNGPKDISALIKFINTENKKDRHLSLTPRSGGTDMSGGAIGQSIIIDMTRYFNIIRELGAGFAITEPGVYYRDFERETMKKNLLLPSYPASREICTMGGMVANNSAGEKTLAYGKTENYVEELNVVLADGNEYKFKELSLSELEEKKKLNNFEGEVYRKMHQLLDENYERILNAKPRVSKNSAGYNLWGIYDRNKGTFDLNKLFSGSQGTLGVITKIKFKLINPKRHSRLLVIFVKDFNQLAGLANHVLAFRPESFESFDDHTFMVAMKLFPEIIKRMKGNFISLGLKFLPEFWAVVTGGIPKLVLIAEFTADTDGEALSKACEAKASLREFHIKTRITNAKEGEKYWVMRRESFNLLRHRVQGMHTAPFIDDIIVRPDKLPEFLPELYGILNQYKNIIYTIAGHVGDANFHIIPLMDFKRPETRKIIAELSEKVFDLTIKFGGSITGEHNDGLIRGPFLERMFGSEVFRLFKETKNIFDPNNVFNPDKKTGASFQFAIDHILRA